MIETRRGPAVLHSFLNPRGLQQQPLERGIVESAREELRPVSKGTESTGEEEEELIDGVEEDEEDEGSAGSRPPLLIASVVLGSVANSGEARMAAARLERLGREFQLEWEREQLEGNEVAEEDEDD